MKNKILIGITKAMIVVFVLSVLAVDSDTWIPIITLFISLTWICLFMYVNRDYLRRKGILYY